MNPRSFFSCGGLEAIAKFGALASHGDFRQFLYEATVKSMLKACEFIEKG